MLLWISAAGFAGAGWLGWTVWQDYDWSGVRVFNRSAVNSPAARMHRSYSTDGQVSADANLLGSTQTNWGGVHDLTQIDQSADYEPDCDSESTHSQPIGTVIQPVDGNGYSLEDQDINLTSNRHEDFVVVQPRADLGNSRKEDTLIDLTKLGETGPPSVDEDFVVVESNPALSAVSEPLYPETNDEDFVVVGDDLDEVTGELPEVDLTDYLNQWTPIVPKVAALITHELWPQLRTYLESLPQFGDANLERVVNAVAEDVRVESSATGGVGEESATGFAFYATLFEQMENEPEATNA
ncbi:hypothetical protein J2I47_07720 [Fibrella sp. HMF5335]|uniref:Uncharacterized protein n=1 Tax=Fibrella rubiginis TaxID=2817060 RepID=A0A939GCA9_9BACT|nr:hypothetical protein [Fibrella rubiginis]MBO0936432.1 hypothetical protein [Fibrella rubiginis]